MKIDPTRMQSAPSVSSDLKIAVLLNSLTVPAWIYQSISQIVAIDSIEIVSLILNSESGFVGEVDSARGFRHLLYRLYIGLDRRLFKEPMYDPDQIRDLRELLPDVRLIESGAEGDSDMDVILNYCNGSSLADFAEIPKYGIWTYRFGEGSRSAGLHEVLFGSSTTITEVSAHSAKSQMIIDRAVYRTHNRSFKLNRARMLRKAARLIPDKVRQLSQLGNCVLLDLGDEPNAVSPRDLPGNLQMMSGMLKLISTYISDKVLKRLLRPEWFMVYRLGESNRIDTDFRQYKPLMPPRGHFYADPFPIQRDGKRYLFFEDYIWRLDKGVISVLEIDAEGVASKPQVVLERPYHLSYPFLLEWKGELYMTPEALFNHQVELYKCIEFPLQWEPAGVLMEGIDAVDPTLFEHNGKWWMFTNVDDGDQSYNEDLFLFFADEPFGKWRSHPMNPVKKNLRGSRPAGRIIESAGRLIRPAQDSTDGYGTGMVFYEILELTETAYRERELSFVKPDWRSGLKGVHTYNRWEGLTVIDCLHRISRS
ncbi:hypothetical protein ACFLQV_03440 [Calditrichota bacterium]